MKLTLNSKWRTLLTEILKVQSHSKNEKFMLLYLINKITEMGLDYTLDLAGNILVTKGKASVYPCIVSHMDTVHQCVDEYEVYRDVDNKNDLFALTDGKNPTGIGGDDKCGIFACLYFLTILPAVKVIFFTQEETGCVGSNAIPVSYFSDCRYILQLDRRGNSDLIVKYGDDKTISKCFRKKINSIKDIYKMEFATGATTDCMTLFKRKVHLSCINISSGYFNPHSNTEYVDCAGLANAVNFTQHLIKVCENKSYPYIPPKPVYTTTTSAYNTKYTSEKPCMLCGEYITESFLFRVHNVNICWSCKKEVGDKTGTAIAERVLKIIRPKVKTAILKNKYTCYNCHTTWVSSYCWKCKKHLFVSDRDRLNTKTNTSNKNAKSNTITGYVCWKCKQPLKQNEYTVLLNGHLYCGECNSGFTIKNNKGTDDDITMCELCQKDISDNKEFIKSKFKWGFICCDSCVTKIREGVKNVLDKEIFSHSGIQKAKLNKHQIHNLVKIKLSRMYYCMDCQTVMLMSDTYFNNKYDTDRKCGTCHSENLINYEEY